MQFTTSSIAFSLLAISQLVAGHGAIVKAVGNLGGVGSAMGIDPNTPRNGTTRKPFQRDTTRFAGAQKAVCGKTIEFGNNDIANGTAKIMMLSGGQPLPQISAGGALMMTLHQVNGDGAGPYTCEINADGTGTTWTNIAVTQQVPGKNGNNGKTAKTNQPLNVAIPQGQTCTGTVAGQSNLCIVRCQNPARAGPFGGCVPVQMAAAAAAKRGVEDEEYDDDE